MSFWLQRWRTDYKKLRLEIVRGIISWEKEKENVGKRLKGSKNRLK